MEKSDLTAFITRLTPESVNNLKHMIELGKKPDGSKLSSDERIFCMKAVLVWETKNLPEEKRTGYIPQSCKKRNK